MREIDTNRGNNDENHGKNNENQREIDEHLGKIAEQCTSKTQQMTYAVNSKEKSPRFFKLHIFAPKCSTKELIPM